MVSYIFSSFDFQKFKLKKLELNEIDDCGGKGILRAVFKRRIFPILYLFLFLIYKSFFRKKERVVNGVVIYFGIENMYSLGRGVFINRACRKQAIWLWNPVASISNRRYIDNLIYKNLFLKLLKFVGVDLWTFDEGDSNRYGFKYHPQIHALKKREILHGVENGFIFVGQDKGRLNKLLELKALILQHQVRCDLLVKKDKGVVYYNDDYDCITDEILPYTEYLNLVDNYTGLIDIVQANQDGLTLRVLESIFLQKKLITNNIAIKKFDFYKVENIFIIGDDASLVDLESFLRTPVVPISDSILSKYNIESLITNMIIK